MMSKPVLELCFDAKNVLIERDPTKSPPADKEDIPPLKRRAPKLPPKNKPKRLQNDD